MVADARKSGRAEQLLSITLDVVRQSVPNALSQLALVLIGFITVLFVSRSDDPDILGGVGVGTMLYNIFGLSLGCGITSALDTLVSQSTGAGQLRLAGLYLQRAVFIATLVSLPATLVLCNTQSLLELIGQNPSVAAHAGQYVLGAVPSVWPMYAYFALSSFLRAQKLPEACAVVTWTSNGVHVGTCAFFISYLQLGALGAGLAFSTTQIISCMMLVVYIHFVRPGSTQTSWIGWEWKEATSNLKEYLDLALPCAMLMWAEWWCTEVMSLLAGYLGVAALAAHTSVLQIFILIYMTSGGVSCAAAALVGNAIGARDARLACRSAWVSSGVMLVLCALIDLFIFVEEETLASLFTRDAEVHQQVITLLHILLLVVPLDSIQTVLDGVLRGLGKQALAFKVKLLCMWFIRFPLAIAFAFKFDLGISGVWLGSASGLGATMAAYLPLVLMVDWEAEVEACDLYHVLDADKAWNFPSPVPGWSRSPASSDHVYSGRRSSHSFSADSVDTERSRRSVSPRGS